nr:reverse transcriptase domain-containing protein [Tanacetum cinerariifolium]
PSASGTLPSNTILNPKGEMKAVITRSGLAYEGPSIPTESPLEKVDEQNTEEILDKEHSNSSGSTAQVQPSVVLISIPELDVLRTQPKPSISYPSRDGDMPCPSQFRSKHKSHALIDLEKTFTSRTDPTRMTLELADRSITRPKGVAEDVFVKVPIVKSSSLTLTPFGESDFILEEIEDFLNDDSIPDEIDDSVFDPVGDIHLIEKLLNANPGSLPPMDLKLAEESKEK